jgi:curved DNA-binding protein CbpA
MSNELYETLGVAPDATDDEIKKAYRARARETHPDTGGDVEEFKLVSLAGTVLTDSDKRQRYDETGSTDADSAITPAQKIIADLVVQSFLQKSMPDDPIRWMQEQIDCGRTKLKSMIAESEHKHRQFNERLDKFTKSNAASKNKPAVSLVVEMLTTAIDSEKQSQAKFKAELQHAENAMVLLNDLKYPQSLGRDWGDASIFRSHYRNGWGT